MNIRAEGGVSVESGWAGAYAQINRLCVSTNVWRVTHNSWTVSRLLDIQGVWPLPTPCDKYPPPDQLREPPQGPCSRVDNGPCGNRSCGTDGVVPGTGGRQPRTAGRCISAFPLQGGLLSNPEHPLHLILWPASKTRPLIPCPGTHVSAQAHPFLSLRLCSDPVEVGPRAGTSEWVP